MTSSLVDSFQLISAKISPELLIRALHPRLPVLETSNCFSSASSARFLPSCTAFAAKVNRQQARECSNKWFWKATSAKTTCKSLAKFCSCYCSTPLREWTDATSTLFLRGDVWLRNNFIRYDQNDLFWCDVKLEEAGNLSRPKVYETAS